jgi:hypothetical protein
VLIIEIAAGVVLGVLALVFLPDLLAAAVGVIALGAGLVLVVAILSGGWAGLLAAAVVSVPFLGGVYLHKRLYKKPPSEDVPAAVMEPPPIPSAPVETRRAESETKLNSLRSLRRP